MILSKDARVIKAIKNMERLDSPNGNAHLQAIYARLLKGKKHFETVVTNVLGAVMKMSALDLQLSEQSRTVEKASGVIKGLAGGIAKASAETSQIMNMVTQDQEKLSESIQTISTNSNAMLTGIEVAGTGLANVVQLSNEAIDDSQQMKRDMDNLMDIIKHMSGVINSINAISSQTNLLALNASVEAARAGEYGKGFSVIAEETRQLAFQTNEMTASMDKFISQIEKASSQSTASIEKTADVLSNINTNLDEVLNINVQNKENVHNIVGSMQTIAAATTEVTRAVGEINEQVSTLDQDIDALYQSTNMLDDVKSGLQAIIHPVYEIEGQLNETAGLLGQMSYDPFYMMENSLFIGNIESAIQAHTKWVVSLGNMVVSHTITPLQTDSHKCGFGHFFYNMRPKNREISHIWDVIEGKHTDLHNFGTVVIDALRNDQTQEAQENFIKAKNLSQELIAHFEDIIKITERIDKEGRRVFEA